MLKNVSLAIIPGDGVGREVTPGAANVLDTVAEIHGGLSFQKAWYPYSCDYYLKHGRMMAEDGLDQLGQHDHIFLGAVGNPKLVPDHTSLWGLLIAIRREFQQVINVRPAKKLRGIDSPLSQDEDFDFVVVRENSEGEYSEVGGRIHQGDDEIAIQNAIFTRKKTERVMKYAFSLAENRRKYVMSATKSNGIVHSMPFWDEVFKDVGEGYPSIDQASSHIDALAASLVSKPHELDVVVASNLFGDILTDIGAAIMGSIGVAPAANLNVNGKYPSMFEPVHGSAPDIEGKGIANPIGQIWTGKMLLDHIGEHELSTLLLNTIEEVLGDGFKTQDIGGTSSTEEVTSEIIRRLKNN